MMAAGGPQEGFLIGFCIGALPPLFFWLYYACSPMTHTLADIVLSIVKTFGLPVALLSGLLCGLVGLVVGAAYQRFGSHGWLFSTVLIGIALAIVLAVKLLGTLVKTLWHLRKRSDS